MSDQQRLSREQSRAVETLNTRVHVSAGAGTGKTETAARRFLQIIDQGRARVDEILVVTFTERSSREFRADIRRLCGERLPIADTGRAQVFTLTGLCRKILRENVIEAALKPRFKVIGFAQARTLIRELIDDLLGSEEAEPVADLLLAYYQSTRQLGVKPGLEHVPVPSDPLPFIEAFERCFTELVRMSEEFPSGHQTELVRLASNRLPSALESAHRLISHENGVDWRSFHDLRRFRRALRAHKKAAEVIKQQVRATRTALDDFLTACLDSQAVVSVKPLIDLAIKLDERYEAVKAERGLLDRDDLIDRTLCLLTSADEVAQRYRERYKFAILCDYHDAGPRDQRILDAICRPDNTLVVQDERQSILSFTSGGIDPVLVRRDIETPRRAREIRLSACYRSRPGITDFINTFFEKLWDEDVVRYERVSSAGSFAPKDRPDVEIRLFPRIQGDADDPEVAAQRDRREAEGIARRICDLTGICDCEPLVLTKEGREGRPVSLGDIVVLFRSSASIPVYALELERWGIKTSLPGVRDSACEDAVRLMTIHRARGSQFPIVFIAGMSHGLGHEPTEWLFDNDWGLAVQVRDPVTGDMRSPLCFRELAERVEERSSDEDKRLLYVAMTRAEEHLVLMGSSDLQGRYASTYRDSGTWTGWLEKAFGLTNETPNANMTKDGCAFKFTYGLEQQSQKHVPNAQMIPQDSVVFTTIERDRIPPVVTRFSVSGVLDYLDCPARYRFVHIIGMPGITADPPDDEQDEPVSGATLGHIVHDLLDKIDFEREVETQVAKLLMQIPDHDLRETVRPLVDRFIDSRWRRELSASNHILKEKPFEILVAGKVLAGRMDVMYRGEDGWTILDYKTGQAESLDRYELQVGIYAYVAHKLMGEMPSQAALLLLTLDDEWVRDTSDGQAARLAAEKLQAAADGIDAGVFDPGPGRSCEWCSFGTMCGG